METYKVSERVIFDLFSEFTAMMTLQDQEVVLEHEVARGNCQYAKDLTRLFPSGSKGKARSKMSIISVEGQVRKMRAGKSPSAKDDAGTAVSGLSTDELNSMSVRVRTFKAYSRALKNLQPGLKERILTAAGVEPARQAVDSLSWDRYVRLNCLIMYGSATRE